MVVQTAPTIVEEDGIKYISWSEAKTWQRCPKQWDFKYGQNLVPVKKARPLFLGNWIHAALESYYVDGDWRIGHATYLEEYEKLFEEEREELEGKKGPLPQLVERVIKSYLWYYREDGWKVLHVEVDFKVPLKAGIGVKGRIDLIVEDPEGNIWVVDHKTTANIPEPNAFHAMDPQLMVYPWAIEKQLGIKVTGIVYNYVKSKPPSIPKINKDGSLSKRRIVTDYPTLVRFLKRNGYDPKDFVSQLRPLARQSPFLRRYKLPREKNVTLEILQDFLTTSLQIRDHKRTPRIITRDCVRCSYHDICRAELNGFDTTPMRKHQFTLRNKEQDYVEPEVGDEDSEEPE
jgi:hypothetical protein